MTIQKWPNGLPRELNRLFPKVESISKWFEIYRINDTTFAILEPHHDEEVFSFLLVGKGQAVLIDTGMGIANIVTEVENITDSPILVLNTHSHFDHTGDNHRFNYVSCFDDQYEYKNLETGYSAQFCDRFMQPGSYRNLSPGFKLEDYKIKPSKKIGRLNHLDQIDIGNRTLTIHHTPGHSPGSICIEDSLSHILFTGDTYYRGTIFLHLPGSNFQEFVESIDYLHSLRENVDFLCPSHNECFAPINDIDILYDSIQKVLCGKVMSRIEDESIFIQFENFNLRLSLDALKPTGSSH